MPSINIDRAIEYYENDIPFREGEFSVEDLIEYIIKLKSESLVKKETIEMIEQYRDELHCTSMEKDLEMQDVLEHFNYLIKQIKKTNYSFYDE